MCNLIEMEDTRLKRNQIHKYAVRSTSEKIGELEQLKNETCLNHMPVSMWTILTEAFYVAHRY